MEHARAVLAMYALAAATAAALLAMPAPYGRHAREGWGPTLPARQAWMLMEAPASLGFLAVHLLGPHRAEPVPLLLLGLWQLHYAQRAFLYPLRLAPTARPMPSTVVALGAAFNTFNAWLQARQVATLGAYPAEWLTDPRFLAGTALFAAGYAVNRHADAILLGLRRAHPGVYTIPHGGLYRWVSCPNYLGEIVQWLGWALLTASGAGLAFATYTAANLVPRALDHHRWYRARFPDYPPERRALVPYLL